MKLTEEYTAFRFLRHHHNLDRLVDIRWCYTLVLRTSAGTGDMLRWYALMIRTGDTSWSCALIVHAGDTRWWCALVMHTSDMR